MSQVALPARGSLIGALNSHFYHQCVFQRRGDVLCTCASMCVIIQWMEEYNLPPPLEIKAINAAQDVGNEVMEAERPELAARGASALSNNTQLQAGRSHADQADRHCRTEHQTWGAALSPVRCLGNRPLSDLSVTRVFI